MKLQRPDPGIDAAKSGLHGKAGIFFNAGLFSKGGGFNPLDLDPYLLFDARTSMIGTLENPTLDLDPSKQDTLDVITATRAGVATYTDVNGLIASAPANTVRVDQTQGAELTPTKFQRVENTDFSQWSHARTSGTANAAISPDGQNNATYVEQDAGQTNAGSIFRFNSALTGVFTLSVYAKKKEKDFVVLYDSNIGRTYFNLETGTVGTIAAGNTANIEDAGNGWFRCSTTFTASSGAVKAFYVGYTDNSLVVTGSGGIYIWGPQLEEGTTASDFVANTTGSPKFITGPTFGPRVPMILVEPSATNSFLYSQPTSALAFGGGGIRTFDAATAPNGETEAFRITNNGTSGNHNYRATSSITFGSDSMVLSVWAKAGSGGNNYFTWSFQNLGGAVVRAGFKLEGDGETQIITNGNGGHTLQIETYPDGWYRCIIIGNTQSSGTTTQFLYTVSGYTEHSSIAGGSVLLWGFQVESGSVATSYIPTSGSTVTRAADDLVISGSDFSDFYNQSEGTVYAEVVTRGYDGYFLSINDGTTTNRIVFKASSANFFVSVGGAIQNNLTYTPYPVSGSLYRRAGSYKANNFLLSNNGAAIISNTSGLVPSSVTQIQIGKGTSVGTHLNGHIKRLIYWPYHSDSL